MKKSILLTITFLLIAATTFAQSGKMKRANRHFEKGNYKKAFRLYDKVLNIEDNDEAKIKGAYACLKTKNYKDAEYWFYLTIRIESTPSEYLLYYVACLINNRYGYSGILICNPDKSYIAKSWLEAYKKISPNDTRIVHLEQILESCHADIFLIVDWNKIILE
jgi:tetratricopeptide (TPR) repeat protein